MKSYLKVISTGISLPEKVLTNADLEKMVETSDEWIVTRTGIRERRISAPGVSTSDLATEAVGNALKAAGKVATDIELLIVATATPDFIFPSTATVAQRKLGAVNAACFDISAACSGFLYGLTVAYGLLNSGLYKNAMVVGAETLTKITDYEDRSTCVLFGDGSGAAFVELGEDGEGLFASHLGSDGSYVNILNMPAGGTALPASVDTVNNRLHYIKMEGNELFKVAVRKMEEASRYTLEKADLSCDDVDLLIPHQANTRIIEGLAKRVLIDNDKVYRNIEKYGNTSAASIPIAYHEAREKGLVNSSSNVLMVAFGGGVTWGGILLRG